MIKDKEVVKDNNKATQEFNEQLRMLVDIGDVEPIDKEIPKPEYEKKTKRWFGEKNKRL